MPCLSLNTSDSQLSEDKHCSTSFVYIISRTAHRSPESE